MYIIFLLFFPFILANASLCEESIRNAGSDVGIELKNIILRVGDRSLDLWVKALDSHSVRLRRGAIKYLSRRLPLIKIKYKSIFPIIYNRIFEVAQSDPNLDLQLKAFQILYDINPLDNNLRRLAEIQPNFYHELSLIIGSKAEVAVEIIVEDDKDLL